jgi:hypothetical protein
MVPPFYYFTTKTPTSLSAVGHRRKKSIEDCYLSRQFRTIRKFKDPKLLFSLFFISKSQLQLVSLWLLPCVTSSMALHDCLDRHVLRQR